MNFGDKLRIGGARVGNIFFGVCVLAAVLTLFSAFTPLMMAFYLLLFLILIVITLGTVFLFVDNFANIFTASSDTFASFTQSALKAMPYIAVLTVVTAVLAVALLMLDVRVKRHTSKVVGAVICAVLAIVFALLSKAVMK